MRDAVPPDPWTVPGWRDAAVGWIEETLDTLGFRTSGPIEQAHVRHWSTVLRIPTRDADLYFKASAPDFAQEPALTEALARWRPDCVLAPLAIERERGWMLMPDGGTRLRESLSGPDDIWRWEPILTRFAEVQIDLVRHVEEMLAVGAPDHRLAILPAFYARLLGDTGAMRLDLPQGVTSAELGRLRALAPKITEMCGRLAAHGLPETPDDKDFHDGNIFVREQGCLFFDWGDACVAHPFFSGVAALRGIEDRFELTWDGSELRRLRDVYLEMWTRYGSRDELVAAFELATPLALISGALGWQSIVPRFPDEFPDAVSTWLKELLETVDS
jgi:hypothetical protein